MKIRMYKVGLGDCLLLAFPGEDRTVHVLVDCGVITGTAKPKETMMKVARDIRDATGGRLDVIAATHEHWDHVSGFLQAKEVFDDFTVGEVWLAWTEDPADSRAGDLRRERALRLAALRAALARWGDAGVQTGLRAAVASVLDFFGDPLAAAGNTTRAALDSLSGRADAAIRYLGPGQVVRLPGVPAARVFVLGPPREDEFLRKDLPTKTGKETYEESGIAAEAGFLAALGIGASPSEPGFETPSCDAFDAHWRIGREEAKRHPFFGARYGFAAEASGDNASWRRIDGDWLAVAGRLALDLDRDTNNTSLVLAVELGASGDVILLAADAQVGSWESWHARTWTVEDDGGGTRTVTAADLLARTVLYKVGHHGSHNATLREQGLEMMAHRGLMAMIPVDHAMAEKKKWGRIPFEPLLARLGKKCRGRVMRIDTGVPPEDDATLGDALSPAERAAFRAAVTETELYVELEIPAGG